MASLPFFKGRFRGIMGLYYNKGLKQYARELRKNMTEAETKLWYAIRKKQIEGYQFYRQKIIGNYIVDFYCPRARIIVEVDGSQHYLGEKLGSDKKRDEFLRRLGFKVLRYNDIDVLGNIEGVFENILENVNKRVCPPV